MHRALLLSLAASSLCVVAGCGTAGGDVSTEVKPGGTGADRATNLTIVVTAGPGAGTRTYTLTCDPPGGDHPNAEAACRALADMKDPFAPVPADVLCTEIYGGPQTATVTGTFRGAPVNAQFSRTDGCQIARWDKHAAVLVERGGAAGA